MSKEIKIVRGSSLHNGVMFYSRLNKGYIAKAELSEEGIVTSYYKKEANRLKDNPIVLNSMENIIIITTFILSVIAIIGIILSYILQDTMLINLFWILLFIAGTIMYLTSTFAFKRHIYVRQFHGAEHVGFNAINKLKTVPTINELKQFSRFNCHCGTTSMSLLLTLPFIMSIISIIASPINSFLMLIIVLALMVYLQALGCFNFIQRITTLPPTDEQLEVAIAGLKVWLENETNF